MGVKGGEGLGLGQCAACYGITAARFRGCDASSSHFAAYQTF